MKFLINDRRTFISFFSICALVFLGYTKDESVGLHIATIAAALAASNAFERSRQNKE